MYEKFARLLSERGVTAYKVSKATGIPTAALSSWKNGKYEPKPDKIRKIADFFGVPVDYFYETGSNDSVYYIDEATRQTAEEIHHRPGMRALFSAARELSDDKLQAVAAMIERLKETNPDA